ncbi:MAG: cytochrome o ubiquinol oxidase subunit III [Minisyncoccia bacterium]
MTTHTSNHREEVIEARHTREAKSLFGFWVYLMSDALLFGSIFATYAVLHGNTFGGPGAKELFSMPFVLTETLILLASSFTYGLASIVARHHHNKRMVLMWLGVTALLGLAFLGMEMSEFTKLFEEGNTWQKSGFLSAFFTLVGTHGLHVTAGIIWMVSLMVQVSQRGITVATTGKISMLGLFWHFLDIIWIFIFTFVYLMGAI